VNISRYQADWIVYGLRQLLEIAPLTRIPVRRQLREVFQQLDDLLWVTCDDETESSPGLGELRTNDLVGTTAAAEILECTPQWVRQIANDLGAQRCQCGSGWLFDRQAVLDYAQTKGECDDGHRDL